MIGLRYPHAEFENDQRRTQLALKDLTVLNHCQRDSNETKMQFTICLSVQTIRTYRSVFDQTCSTGSPFPARIAVSRSCQTKSISSAIRICELEAMYHDHQCHRHEGYSLGHDLTNEEEGVK